MFSFWMRKEKKIRMNKAIWYCRWRIPSRKWHYYSTSSSVKHMCNRIWYHMLYAVLYVFSSFDIEIDIGSSAETIHFHFNFISENWNQPSWSNIWPIINYVYNFIFHVCIKTAFCTLCCVPMHEITNGRRRMRSEWICLTYASAYVCASRRCDSFLAGFIVITLENCIKM